MLCRLCRRPIGYAVDGSRSWTEVSLTGRPIPGGVSCETTTGEVTGHLPA